MTLLDIAHLRLSNQRISHGKFDQPGEVVAWMGAMQAQDYENARWAVGLRCVGVTNAGIEQAIAGRSILRTWLLRGTLHLVSPQDIRWIISLLAPRRIASSSRRDRELELDEVTYVRSFTVLTDELLGSVQRTRKNLMAALERAGISTQGQQGYHILARAALQGLICFGPYQGKEQTFVLLEDWVQPRKQLEREEALAELARRYFAGHGPASLADFTWWSGPAAAEARQALELVKAELDQVSLDDQLYSLYSPQANLVNSSPTAYLLPAFDEYYLGYSERSAVRAPRFDRMLVSSNGVFRPMLVIDGQVVGTWRREIKKDSVIVRLQPFEPLQGAEENALRAVAAQYGVFLGLPVELG